MKGMKNMAIVCNIGHFDSEIQIAALSNYKWTEVKPQVDLVEFPDGKQIIILSKGRLVNLGNATGHPSFVMSSSFTNTDAGADRAVTRPTNTRTTSTSCRSIFDEKVARIAPRKAGVKLTKLTKKQADYIGVPVEGRTSRIIIGIDQHHIDKKGRPSHSERPFFCCFVRCNKATRTGKREATIAIEPMRCLY